METNTERRDNLESMRNFETFTPNWDVFIHPNNSWNYVQVEVEWLQKIDGLDENKETIYFRHDKIDIHELTKTVGFIYLLQD